MNLAKNIQETNLRGFLAATIVVLLIASSSAFAHHPMGGTTPQTLSQGFLSGLAHPVIGLDHLAFLVVAMLLAYVLKGAARFLVPLVFIAGSIAGTLFHVGSANIPMSETLVALSVVIGGVLVLTRRSPGALVLGAIFAISGILHGYAYGEAIVGAETTPLLAYLTGLAIIQYGLIIGGILLLDKIVAQSPRAALIAARVGGMAAVLSGGVFLALGLV